MESHQFETGMDVLALRTRIKYFSLYEIGVGLFFWTWALIIMVSGVPFDSGIVVMVIAVTAGIFGILSSNQQGCCCWDPMGIAKTHFIMTILAHGMI